jgi:molybdopterin-guanine dinucleotide biosynthesis protein A
LTVWSGAVLAGGASRRMGRDKALLEVDGQPMAVRVADALAGAGASEVFCVGGDPELRSHGLRLVGDEHPGEGPLDGLVAALSNAAHDLVVVLACDLLAPSVAAVGRLVDSAADRPDPAAIVPVVGDRPQWLHGAWRRDECLTSLVAAFDTGERSIHRAVAALDVAFVVDDGPGFADADVPGDLDGGGYGGR